MNALRNVLTKHRELNTREHKRVLIFRAAFSLAMAIAATLLGARALLKNENLWSGVPLLVAGTAYFVSFSLRVRSIKPGR